MAYNDEVIKTLRHCFEPDENDMFTNCALIFAYNGTGKTRLSYDFAHYGREEGTSQHTLYYNAFTEDLFTWDNDLENDTNRHLKINQDSALIQGLAGYNFAEPLRKYLNMFTDIDFDFHQDAQTEIPQYVTFSKKIQYQQELNGEMVPMEEEVENIKISRGEERLFVWCFFRCIIDQVLGGNDAYKNIEYIYIDDPMSSLDDNNVIVFAEQLYSTIRGQLMKEIADQRAGKTDFRRVKFVISSHHALFYHVMVHGLAGDKKLGRFYLHRNKENDAITLKNMSDDSTPFYYNVAMMSEIQNAIRQKRLYTYHFNILRSIMDKIAEFFGHYDYRFILDGITYKGNPFDEESFEKGELTELYSRMVNVFSHQGNFFSPSLMNEDNQESLRTLFFHIKKKYNFILPDLDDERTEKTIAKENAKIYKAKKQYQKK